MKKVLISIASVTVLLVVVFFALQKAPIPIETLKQKYCTAESKFVEIDGMNVHYRIEGEGTPIVLIHGTGACLQTWDAWTDSLKKYYKVVRLDIPAFGLTGPRKDGNYSINMYTTFLHTFFQKIGIDTFAMAGNSLGGQIAWRYALAYPNQVTKLVLVDPGGYMPDKSKHGSIVFKLAKIKWLADLMGGFDTKLLVKQALKDVYYDDSKITPQLTQMYYDMSLREGNRESFSKRVQQIFTEPKADVTKVTCPTLTLWGREDVLIDVSMAEHYKQIPNSKLIIYENMGHVPQEEIPAQSVTDAINFMRTN